MLHWAIRQDAELLFCEVLREEINRHDITVRTRTGNHRSSLRRHKRMMTEFLTAMHIRQVHLNHRKLSRLQRIVQRHRGVRVRRRVDNNRRATSTSTLNLIHQRPLMIRLHKLNIKTMSRRALTHHTLNIVQSGVAVHLGAALPKQVQIRSIKHKNRI